MRGPALLLALLLAACSARARFVIEEGGLKVVLPPDAKSRYPNGFDVALANFGEQQGRRWLGATQVSAAGCSGGWAGGGALANPASRPPRHRLPPPTLILCAMCRRATVRRYAAWAPHLC